ncbi:MAG: thermonuclease family protein [Gammaproteobacteria bacterium]
MATGSAKGRTRGCALFFFQATGRLPALLLLSLLLLPGSGAAAIAGCGPERIDETVEVKRVYDGDTVELEDGRRLRLIGLNTPELGRDGKAPEPLAVAARDALRQLLDESPRIGLRYDRERRDRYGRTLAHLFLADRRSVNAWLIRQGYAAVVVVPPNVWHQACYQRSEALARRQGRGIWRLDYFRPLAADSLQGITGFRFIRGRVAQVGESRRSIWLDLEGGAALRIARKDLVYFPDFDSGRYRGRRIVARGWIYRYRGRPTLQIRHPYSLRLQP